MRLGGRRRGAAGSVVVAVAPLNKSLLRSILEQHPFPVCRFFEPFVNRGSQLELPLFPDGTRPSSHNDPDPPCLYGRLRSTGKSAITASLGVKSSRASRTARAGSSAGSSRAIDFARRKSVSTEESGRVGTRVPTPGAVSAAPCSTSRAHEGQTGAERENGSLARRPESAGPSRRRGCSGGRCNAAHRFRSFFWCHRIHPVMRL